MRSPTVARILSASILLLALGNLVKSQEAAQPRPKHARYKFIDLGTLGGPVSYESVNGEGNQIINDSGVIASSADTSIPDPNAPDFCFNPHPDGCFVTHAARWEHGIPTDLGALPGLNSSAAGAINARGWSVGQSQNGMLDPLTGAPQIRAALWKDGEIFDLGTLGGVWSLATNIADDGQAIGMATIDETPDPFSFFGAPTRPFIWRHGEMMDLGTLGGPDAFLNSGCVNQGLIVGNSFTSSTPDPNTGIPPQDPFLWENGRMIDLGTLGGNFGFGWCGNHRGQVIGGSSLAENPFACFTGDPGCHPFLWEHGVLRDLGTLGGDNGVAIWINDAGEVVGDADLPGSQTHHAFLWRKGVMTDLGTLDGASHATAINLRGQVVGYFGVSGRTEPPFRHAFLWQKGEPMVDLNTLIPANSGLELVAADNINERGEIVGVGVPARCFPDFCGHLFLLIPCAEGDLQSCEDNGEPTKASIQSDPPPAVKSSVSPQLPLTPKERVAAWREQMAKRYRVHTTKGPLS
jgi:probable HAF family extracellular repeat protein